MSFKPIKNVSDKKRTNHQNEMNRICRLHGIKRQDHTARQAKECTAYEANPQNIRVETPTFVKYQMKEMSSTSTQDSASKPSPQTSSQASD
jgi:hypothetical protein